VGSDTTTVRVDNVAPTVVLDPVAAINEDGIATLTGTISDPGTLDTFTLDVDWGDPLSPDNVEQYTFGASASGSQTFSLTHQYLDDNPSGTASDSYTIGVSLVDDDTVTQGDLFAITEDYFVAQDLPYGPNAITESDSAYLSTLNKAVVHDTWTQIATSDGSTTLFTIDWQFSTSKTLEQRFIDAVNGGEPVAWIVTSGMGTQTYNGTWWYSHDAGDMASRFAGSGLYFSNDDGIWGAGNGVIDGDSNPSGDSAVAWGHGNYNSSNGSDILYQNGVRTLPVRNTHPNFKNYMYIGGAGSGGAGGGAITASTTVTVNNVAPTVTLDPVAAINEDGTATLTGTIVDPGTLDTFTLDVNWGDSLSPDNVQQYTFGVSATGSQTFTLTHKYLDDNPTATSQDTYTINVTVTDDDMGVGTDSETVVVNNLAPTVTLDPVATVDEDGIATLTGTITDPGTLDTFTLDIDWGDPLSPDNVEQYTFGASATGSQTFSLTHQYLDDNPTGTSSDEYTIEVSLWDDDTPVSTGGSALYVGGGGIPVSVGRSNLDASGFQTVIDSTGFVRDVEVDGGAGRIYWADASNPGGTNQLYRANLDGSDVQVVTTVTSGIGGVGLDESTGEIYFGSINGLYRVNPDGTGLTQLVSGYIFSDVEVVGSKVYWSSISSIRSANLDGTGETTLVSGQQSIVGLDVVESLGQMFWSDQSGAAVSRSELDGSGLVQLATGQFGARGVAVSVTEGNVYWGTGSTINRASVTGTDQVVVGSLALPGGVLALHIDGSANTAATASTIVTVNNVAPQLANVTETSPINENDWATLSGDIIDPGTRDTFTLDVDWGDGNVETFNYPAGTTSFSETHQYLDDDPTGTPQDDYTIDLTLTDDDGTTSTVNATPFTIFDNGLGQDDTTSGYHSSELHDMRVYDDFTLSQAASIESVFFQEGITPGGTLADFEFAIYADAAGNPGSQLFSTTASTGNYTATPNSISSTPHGQFYDIDFNLPSPIALGPGTYYVSFYGLGATEFRTPNVGSGNGFLQQMGSASTYYYTRIGDTPFRLVVLPAPARQP